MENQHHNQQQKLQRQQGSQISPTLSQPEIKYENSCNCSNMVMDERDPERCAHCHDHKYPILSNGNLELLYTFVFVLHNIRNNVISHFKYLIDMQICIYTLEWTL
jgi:hypothetical protein